MRFHRLKVLRRLPHPGRGFTQGLLLSGDTVWESTGLYGQSALRRYKLGAGECEACAPLPPELFAEGICRAGEAIWQLTWQERTALRWHPDTLALLETIPYNREGWGICSIGDHVLTSDGSSELVRRDPQRRWRSSGSAVRASGSAGSTTWNGPAAGSGPTLSAGPTWPGSTRPAARSPTSSTPTWAVSITGATRRRC
jgi:glutaminyl-peptide cyclotransferase